MKSLYLLLILSVLISVSLESFSSSFAIIKQRKEELKTKLAVCINEKGSETLKKFFENIKSKRVKYIFENDIISLNEVDKKTYEECKKGLISEYEKLKQDISENRKRWMKKKITNSLNL